jgi:hypothetical protein
MEYSGDFPEDWGIVSESQLPEELQDWSLFKRVGNEYVYTGPKHY